MSRVQINSMAIKQIEKYYQQGILNKREVIAILMKENGWNFPEAKQIADYYERVFIKNSKRIKSSKYTPDDLFDLCRWDMLEHTVFLDREECKNAKLGMSDLIDLLNDVAPYWAGVDNLDKLKDICRKAKNPSAKARLEMLETAEDNARFTDKFYNSFKVHKQIKSNRSQANLEGYNCGHKGGGDLNDNPYDKDTQNEEWDAWRAGYSEGEMDRIHSSRQIKSDFVIRTKSGKYLRSPFLNKPSNSIWTNNLEEACRFEDEFEAKNYIYDLAADGHNIPNVYMKIDYATGKELEKLESSKQIKSTRTGENLEGYDARYDDYTADDNPYKFWIGMGDEKQYNDWNDGWESADYEINYLSKRRNEYDRT